MTPRFVHIYYVMRAKIAVHADDVKEAIEKASELFAYSQCLNSIAPHGDGTGEELPDDYQGFIYAESAEEVTGYLIDHTDDPDYEHSQFLDASGEPEPPGTMRKQITAHERDTILAALRFWQRCGHEANFEEWEISRNGQDTALSNDAIDTLCERINS